MKKQYIFRYYYGLLPIFFLTIILLLGSASNSIAQNQCTFIKKTALPHITNLIEEKKVQQKVGKIILANSECLICIQYVEYAETVMYKRYAGLPKDMLFFNIRHRGLLQIPGEKAFMRAIVNSAYNEPVFNSEAKKQEHIRIFLNRVYRNCVNRGFCAYILRFR